MKPNLDPKTLWPGLRPALLRLVLIALLLVPLSWVFIAFMAGGGKPDVNEAMAELGRHFLMWMVVLIIATAMVFGVSLVWKFPRLDRVANRLISERALRRSLITLAWLVTLIVLFYAEEDWRGAREWNHYRLRLEARGAQLDLAAFTPKPIPDDQNFAALPLIESWFSQKTNFDKKWADHYSLANSMIGTSNHPAAPEGNSYQDRERYFLDLVAWKTAFDDIQSGQTNINGKLSSGTLDPASRAAAAPAVLNGLVSSETELDQLRAASDRPEARYPVVYDMENPWGILLPHLGNVKRNVQRLQLRACAELAAGRSDDALADVKLMLYLADSFKDEPFLISHLVRLVCVQLAIQPVWEGLAEHAWSDAQLQELQSRFQSFDFLPQMERSLAGEQAAAILTADLLARGKYHLNDLTENPNPGHSGSTPSNLLPHGWYNLEKLHYCQLFGLQFQGAFDSGKKRVFPGQIASNTEAFNRAIGNKSWLTGNGVSVVCFRHQLLARILLPALHVVPRRSAAGQTAANEAAIACALERYRLANGQFPENLEGLVPRFISQLPDDVISGAAYQYHRTRDGQFVLYSVGWNEKDDDGVSGPTLFDEKAGDWVWQYPVK